MELYKKYRPTKFSEVVGQDEVVEVLTEFGKRKSIPHCILFVGPSGCGKTTIARILRKKMKCGDTDFQEMNVADFRGIDMVRDIRSRMSLAPINGKVRVWLIDECASLTKDAMNAFLKMLEDTPDHVYFFLATTDPQKLLRTIRTRATEIAVKPLNSSDMEKLIKQIVAKEQQEMGVVSNITEDITDKIVKLTDGSPRKALVLLNQVIGIEDEEKALAVLSDGVAEEDAIELARLLLNPKVTWAEVAKLIKSIKGIEESVEGIRWLILGYMSSVALSNSNQTGKACRVMEAFRDHFYDCKKAGLILACREAIGME